MGSDSVITGVASLSKLRSLRHDRPEIYASDCCAVNVDPPVQSSLAFDYAKRRRTCRFLSDGIFIL